MPLLSMRRIPAAVTLGLLALAMAASPAMGGTELQRSGKAGVWTLQDSPADPAAQCLYDLPSGSGNDLDLLETSRSPRVLARDRTAARDRQWVGIRIIFQRSREDGGAGGWERGKATPLVKKLAADDQAVGIGSRAWQLQAADKAGTPHYRATALIRWYRPGSKTKVQGTVRVRYDEYAVRFGAFETVEQERCLPEP